MAEAFPTLLIISFLAIWLWRATTPGNSGGQFWETAWVWVWVVVPIFAVIAFILGI